jgi:hypothetical protein
MKIYLTYNWNWKVQIHIMMEQVVSIFTQGNDTLRFDAKIHLCIIFVNRTIVPVEIDCSSIPNFVLEQKFTETIVPLRHKLKATALINGYVLIESIIAGTEPTGSDSAKQMIVSWDGKIQKYR